MYNILENSEKPKSNEDSFSFLAAMGRESYKKEENKEKKPIESLDLKRLSILNNTIGTAGVVIIFLF